MKNHTSPEIYPLIGHDTMQGRRVTLIGGAGFIGHHLALKLSRLGAQVDVVDSLQVNHLQYIATKPNQPNRELYLQMLHKRLEMLEQAGVTVHPVDARNYHMLAITLEKTQPQIIVQLAAVAHANRSNKDPYSTFDHSLRTLENALDYARDHAEHFIYFSSSMVYGNFQTPSVSEDHPLNPIGIYGALKLSGEKIVQAYQQVFDLPYTIIRPSALYGPRCVSRRVSQIFLENAMEGLPIRVEGDGQERIDFTYVDDLADGVCTAMQTPSAKNEIFNLTHGNARSLTDLVDVVSQHFPQTEIQYVERDRLRPFRGTLCVDKAKTLLGYNPCSPLEVGIPKCMQSYRELGFWSPLSARTAAA